MCLQCSLRWLKRKPIWVGVELIHIRHRMSAAATRLPRFNKIYPFQNFKMILRITEEIITIYLNFIPSSQQLDSRLTPSPFIRFTILNLDLCLPVLFQSPLDPAQQEDCPANLIEGIQMHKGKRTLHRGKVTCFTFSCMISPDFIIHFIKRLV